MFALQVASHRPVPSVGRLSRLEIGEGKIVIINVCIAHVFQVIFRPPKPSHNHTVVAVIVLF